MKSAKILLVVALATPAPMLAASSTDIEAKGSAPTFCNISNDGGPITMAISASGDQLSGNGSYTFVANGNSRVVISALQQVAPNGAAASLPTIALADLVSNNSTSAEAASGASGGVIRKQGNITASITQDNSSGLLSAGDYALTATATCTSL
jgi:hypothetical protein